MGQPLHKEVSSLADISTDTKVGNPGLLEGCLPVTTFRWPVGMLSGDQVPMKMFAAYNRSA